MVGPVGGYASSYGGTNALQGTRERIAQAKKDQATQGQENLKNAKQGGTSTATNSLQTSRARQAQAQQETAAKAQENLKNAGTSAASYSGTNALQASRARQAQAQQDAAAKAGANLASTGSTATAEDTRKRLEGTATKLEKDLAGATSTTDRAKIQENLDKVRGSLNAAAGTNSVSDQLGARLRQAGGTTDTTAATDKAATETKAANDAADKKATAQSEIDKTIEKLSAANQRQRSANANRLTAAYGAANRSASIYDLNA